MGWWADRQQSRRRTRDEPGPQSPHHGILTILASLAVVTWAVGFADHRRAGRGLVLLSVVMLLFGGGFGPPALGVLAAAAAGGAYGQRQRWAHASASD